MTRLTVVPLRIESEAGKRQKPAPLPTPGWNSASLTLKGTYCQIFRMRQAPQITKETCWIRDSLYSQFSGLQEICVLARSSLEGRMEARGCQSTSSDWRELYKAALFEDDDTKIPQRIAEAERALAVRATQLLVGETQVRERAAMENAAYFLQLLRKIEATAKVPCEPLQSSPQPA